MPIRFRDSRGRHVEIEVEVSTSHLWRAFTMRSAVFAPAPLHLNPGQALHPAASLVVQRPPSPDGHLQSDEDNPNNGL